MEARTLIYYRYNISYLEQVQLDRQGCPAVYTMGGKRPEKASCRVPLQRAAFHPTIVFEGICIFLDLQSINTVIFP